jgi:hypothetical protein
MMGGLIGVGWEQEQWETTPNDAVVVGDDKDLDDNEDVPFLLPIIVIRGEGGEEGRKGDQGARDDRDHQGGGGRGIAVCSRAHPFISPGLGQGGGGRGGGQPLQWRAAGGAIPDSQVLARKAGSQQQRSG